MRNLKNLGGGKSDRAKEEHYEYVQADLRRIPHTPTLLDRILHNEKYYTWRFWYHLRRVEYHYGKAGLHKLAYIWHWYRYKRYCWINKWTIRPFTVGPGALGLHVGDFVYIGEKAKVGMHFTFGQGVVLDYGCNIEIGDNVMIYPGVKIVKSVKIGNNVTIGANSVVTHDIPDNSVVSGVPARIHIKKSNE